MGHHEGRRFGSSVSSAGRIIVIRPRSGDTSTEPQCYWKSKYGNEAETSQKQQVKRALYIQIIRKIDKPTK